MVEPMEIEENLEQIDFKQSLKCQCPKTSWKSKFPSGVPMLKPGEFIFSKENSLGNWCHFYSFQRTFKKELEARVEDMIRRFGKKLEQVSSSEEEEEQ